MMSRPLSRRGVGVHNCQLGCWALALGAVYDEFFHSPGQGIVLKCAIGCRALAFGVHFGSLLGTKYSAEL